MSSFVELQSCWNVIPGSGLVTAPPSASNRHNLIHPDIFCRIKTVKNPRSIFDTNYRLIRQSCLFICYFISRIIPDILGKWRHTSAEFPKLATTLPPSSSRRRRPLSEPRISIERRVAGGGGAVNSWVDESRGGRPSWMLSTTGDGTCPGFQAPSHKSHCLTVSRAVRSEAAGHSPSTQAVSNGQTTFFFIIESNTDMEALRGRRGSQFLQFLCLFLRDLCFGSRYQQTINPFTASVSTNTRRTLSHASTHHTKLYLKGEVNCWNVRTQQMSYV